jgi:putative transposase
MNTYDRCKQPVLLRSIEPGQFRSKKFRATLKAHRLTGSMGRVSSAADNAAMESFYALVQKNVLNRRRRWRTRAELRYELVVWIEHTYNRRRRQRALGRLTPVEFELAFAPPPCLEDDQAA